MGLVLSAASEYNSEARGLRRADPVHGRRGTHRATGETDPRSAEDFAAAFGFGDGAGLETFVRVDQWAGIDHNDNGFVCMKRRPITPGNPAYFFNGVDDEPSSPSGESA